MKIKLLILVLTLQVGWILTTVGMQEHRLSSGISITLETAPVDPRDLLRGDYVILNYKVSTLTNTLFTPSLATNNLPEGRPVYVLLEKHGLYHEAVQASTGPLTAGAQQVLMKGTSRWSWNGGISVNYGIERFYVREGTGNPRGKLTAQVAVSASGQGLLKELYVDGRPYAEAMRLQK